MNSAIRNIAGWRAAIQLLVEKGSQMDAENITSLLAKVWVQCKLNESRAQAECLALQPEQRFLASVIG
jgi:hypothetical protein